MISKIKDTSAQIIQQYQKGELARSGESDKTGGSAAAVTEKVDLSSRAKDIQQVRQILEDIPDVREDKVAELKRQIDNGTYQVNADKIAEKMVSESLIDLII